MTINTLYDRNYYEDGIRNRISCYENYRWLGDETINATKTIINFADIKENELVLDFGCAKGFYVHAFRMCNINAYGYDISNYAISNCKKEVKNFVSNDINSFNKKYDLILCKDVFEHFNIEDLTSTLGKLRYLTHSIFIIVPLGNGKKYYYPDDNLDVTHIIKEDFNWWHDIISINFKIVKETKRICGLKDKQYLHNKDSCGFFYATSLS